MTRQVTLTAEQEAELLETYRTTSDLWLRDRCQAVLMVARGGRRRQDIARDLDVSARTLRRYVDDYLTEGLAGLVVHWHTGPQHKISAEVGAELVQWVREGPSGCGLERANWTLEELAEHLYQTHGVRVCAETMRQFCRRHGIRLYRPTYRFLRGDPEKQAQATEALEDLKKKRSRANSSC